MKMRTNNKEKNINLPSTTTTTTTSNNENSSDDENFFNDNNGLSNKNTNIISTLSELNLLQEIHFIKKNI